MDDHGQMHVLEVVIVAGMLLMSLYFVRSLDFSPRSIINYENKIKDVGTNILENLAATPDSQGEYPNLLVKFAMENDTAIIENFLSSGLPEGCLYDFSLINLSKIAYNSSVTVDDCTTVLGDPSVKIGEEFRATRVFAMNGYVYEIVLFMYYTLRRGL